MKDKIIFVDIDGTLCSLVPDSNYNNAVPDFKVINIVNKLYNGGNTIIIWTARGGGTGIDWEFETREQLDVWGVKFHELHMGKPHYDLMICDKTIHPKDLYEIFYKESVK